MWVFISRRIIKLVIRTAVKYPDIVFLKIIKLFTFNIYASCHKYNFTFVKINERGCKMRKPKEIENLLPSTLRSSLPVIEITGNGEITIEGSTGVLKYESNNIKVNTKLMVISIIGRKLNLKYLSSSSLIIQGTILSLELIT